MNLKEYQEQFFIITHKTYPAFAYKLILSNLFENYNIKTISHNNNMFNNYKKIIRVKITIKLILLKK